MTAQAAEPLPYTTFLVPHPQTVNTAGLGSGLTMTQDAKIVGETIIRKRRIIAAPADKADGRFRGDDGFYVADGLLRNSLPKTKKYPGHHCPGYFGRFLKS